MKSKIRKILRFLILPFFPENRELKKHRWHKVIKIVTIIIALSSLYSILWLLAIFFILPQSSGNSLFDKLLYYPAYIPLNISNLLSRFPIYGIVFHALSYVPPFGPMTLIAILSLIYFVTPSLLYRLAIYVSRRFYLRKVKIIFFATVIILGWFIFSTWKYQQLINEGSVIADEQCLKVNPLIIARKNSYVNSMKILQASGSAEDYWTETDKYLAISKQYIEAENIWLATQKNYMDSKDTVAYIPAYIRNAGQLQYDSRVADVEATSGIVELFETYKTIDAAKQKTLSDTILTETKKSNDLNDEYTKVYDYPQRTFDLRDYFTSVPQSKCPPENFNIPDVQDLFNPKSVPIYTGFPVS